MDLHSYFKILSRTENTEDVKIDLNDLAKVITLQEGIKESMTIAQVKELLKLVFTELAQMKPEQVENILKRYRK